MDNLIVLAVIAFVVGAAIGYVYKAKKQGVSCVGCPDAKTCSGHCRSCGGCSRHQ